ncbi:MAG: Do family serine endopeptidase [Bacteroidetes bacterium]|nr:Do family serine endopeptidase [Bacteroidota bacterium]
MQKAKNFTTLVAAAAIGGLLSVSAYHYLESKSGGNNSFFNNAHKVGYEFKTINVPSFDFAEVSQVVTPTVVHIKTKMGTKEKTQQNQKPQSPFDLFGDGFGMPRGPQEASGSGVIISQSGYIITNNHVVADADEIEVVLNDKRSFKGDVVGRDPNTDIALIKINAEGLQAVKIGNSDDVRVGEWVLAVGNPFNLTSTVTAGIVSAKGRNINLLGGGSSIESFIQTDAAVNPGNSGGALINAKGELIGINTAIASQTGNYAGYSFAVPVNIMKKVMDDIVEFGEVQRGFLGVNIRDVDAKLAEEKSLKNVKGIYIIDVNDNSAAETAGIKKGDVITNVGGHEVNSVSALQEQIGRHRPGDEVKIIVDRVGNSKEFTVTLRNKDGKTGKVVSASKELEELLGASLEIATEKQKTPLKIGNGVVVKTVEKGKFKESGIPQGFIITSVDRNGVYSPGDVYKNLKDKKGGIMIEGYLPSGQHKYYILELKTD